MNPLRTILIIAIASLAAVSCGVSTAEVVAEPTGAPAPTAPAPTAVPEPTAVPAPTPEPTAVPAPTPEPTPVPERTPEPTVTPEPTPVADAAPAGGVDIDGPNCIKLTDRSLLDTEEIPCDELHNHQLFAVVELSGLAGASDEDVLTRTQDVCVDAFADITGLSIWLTVDALSFDFIEPSPIEVALGLGSAACVVFYPEDVTVPFADIDPERAFGFSTAAALEPGDCSTDRPGESPTLALVSCSEPHQIEVFYAAALEDPDFPGTPVLQEQLDDACAVAYADQGGSVSEVEISYVHPSAETWDVGDRATACYLISQG